jgi:hypothetical protein
LQLDGLSECYNPTEAGSARDDSGPTSSSKIVSIEAMGATLKTRTRMAYWRAPGDTSPTCPNGAVNKSILSDHEMTKTVSIAGNVITHDITFHVPRDYRRAIFEVLTAYLPPHFSKFWTYDPATDRLAALSDGPGEQPLPIIIATADGSRALGVYSHDLPEPHRRRSGYGRWRFAVEKVVKWNCVFRKTRVTAGDYRYRCYSIIGTLDDVRSAMRNLHR